METATAGPAARLVTAEELWAMGDDARRLELVAGEVREMAPASYGHGRALVKVARKLGDFAEAHGLGDVIGGDSGFVLHRGPDTVLCPDVAFIAAARVPASDHGFAELAPDLVIEIVSPSQSRAEASDKAVRWLDAGVQVVWLIWPAKRRVQIHTGEVDISTLGPDDTLTCAELLPGFELALSELFG